MFVGATQNRHAYTHTHTAFMGSSDDGSGVTFSTLASVALEDNYVVSVSVKSGSPQGFARGFLL